MSASREVRPSPKSRHVFTLQGDLLAVPTGWELLPPGDASMSRRIKQAGPSWVVKERKGRKEFSRGIWAPAEHILKLRLALQIERSDPAYQKKLDQGRQRRAVKEAGYVDDFTQKLRDFLAFHPRYGLLAERVAQLISQHATPVGSGTVARTQLIPIEQRAEAATIAWFRHQTTAYDHMKIPQEKGARREVRRMLAQESRRLLERYRNGSRIDVGNCPLQSALRAPL